MHGDIETRYRWQARRRQAALQRDCQLLGAVLVSEPLGTKLLHAVELGGEHLAVDQRPPALARRSFAVAFCHPAILCSPRAIFGGVRALLGGASSLTGSTHDEVRAGERRRVFGTLVNDPGLHHRDFARGRRLVSSQRRDVTIVGDRVTLLAGAKSRPGALVALIGSALAPIGGALADALADVVLCGVTAGRQVVIAGGLIMVGRYLIAVRAGLVAVGARLIDV